MKKLIELSPDWVLKNLSQGVYKDDGGIMSVFASVCNASWISLALETLKIPFEESEEGEGDELTIYYQFKIKHIKDDCPSLYYFVKNLNKHQIVFMQHSGFKGLNK